MASFILLLNWLIHRPVTVFCLAAVVAHPTGVWLLAVPLAIWAEEMIVQYGLAVLSDAHAHRVMKLIERQNLRLEELSEAEVNELVPAAFLKGQTIHLATHRWLQGRPGGQALDWVKNPLRVFVVRPDSYCTYSATFASTFMPTMVILAADPRDGSAHARFTLLHECGHLSLGNQIEAAYRYVIPMRVILAVIAAVLGGSAFWAVGLLTVAAGIWAWSLFQGASSLAELSADRAALFVIRDSELRRKVASDLIDTWTEYVEFADGRLRAYEKKQHSEMPDLKAHMKKLRELAHLRVRRDHMVKLLASPPRPDAPVWPPPPALILNPLQVSAMMAVFYAGWTSETQAQYILYLLVVFLSPTFLLKNIGSKINQIKSASARVALKIEETSRKM